MTDKGKLSIICKNGFRFCRFLRIWGPILFVILLSGLTFTCCSNKASKEPFTILFAGDLLLDRGVREKIDHMGIESLFHPSVDSLFQTCQLVIANLECPATKRRSPISKQFVFRAEPEWLEVLKKHGITHLNMANNHSMDQGMVGLQDTYQNIMDAKMVPLGFGKNLKYACQPLLLANYPRKIYLISSLQVLSENWNWTEDTPCICETSIDNLANFTQQIKNDDPECIIFIQLHWGAEHTFKPATMQKQQAWQLIDAGADCIVGHHTHTMQSSETYKGKPIFYSIGNFIFDQKRNINTKGQLVKATISAGQISFDTFRIEIKECTPVIQ